MNDSLLRQEELATISQYFNFCLLIVWVFRSFSLSHQNSYLRTSSFLILDFHLKSMDSSFAVYQFLSSMAFLMCPVSFNVRVDVEMKVVNDLI